MDFIVAAGSIAYLPSSTFARDSAPRMVVTP
jgi:hypothetical protein